MIKIIPLRDFLDALREEYPVYGDFLRYHTIRIGDLPYNMSATLTEAGLLYDRLRSMTRGMLRSYIRFAALEKNYVPLLDIEAYIEAKEEIEIESEKELDVENLMETVEDVTHEILYGYLNKEDFDNPEDYVNFDNPTEGWRIFELVFEPTVFSQRNIWVIEVDTKLILEKLNADSSIKRLAKFIVVDPLMYRLKKDYVKKLKKEILNESGEDSVLSVYEFLDVIGVEREEFNEKWEDIRKKAEKALKKEFPFLSYSDEIWRIREARKELEMAKSIISRPDLTEDSCKDVISKSSKALEAILGVIYYVSKGTVVKERTFGQILNELRSEIENTFGEDVFRDLEFIREKRNIVAHPTPIKVTQKDALKVLKKAELFFDLFFSEMGLKSD